MLRYFAAVGLVLCAASAWAASTQNISTNESPRFVLTADLNNDGNLDLLFCSSKFDFTQGGLQLARGAANGVFTAAASLSGGGAFDYTYAAVGKLNGDALPDLVVVRSNSAGGTAGIEIYLNNGNPTTIYGANTYITVGVNPTACVIADFNGDGNMDIAVANSGSNSVSVLFGNGAGVFTAPVNYGTPSPVSIAAGDLNGDGKPEIVTTSSTTGAVSILTNLGNGTFGAPQTLAVGGSPKFVNLIDINGDGRLDLFALLDSSLNVLLGNGDGTFKTAIVSPVIPGSANFSTGDLNVDGKLDIVLVTNLGTGIPSIFLLTGNGDGTFGAAAEFQVNGVGSFSAVGDFNKDGQPDVAATFGNFGNSTLTVRILDPKPTLIAVAPTGALALSPATTLTVTGTNILAGARVRFGSTVLTPATITPPTSLTVSVPAGFLTVPGRFDVSVFNSDASGSGILSNPRGFSVYASTIGSLVVTNTLDGGAGSFRKALQDAQPGDTITFDDTIFNLTNSDAATVINVLSELPALDDGGVTIDASNQRVSVNGSGAGSSRGLNITSSNNTVRGVTLVGFARSGVSLSGGAKTNTIGGSRSTGTGPNGQGMRIANCGTFGVEITGAGTDGNTVKGCWIGLDSSGLAAQANLAGILISGGAMNNVVGGTGAGETNAISGNSFEGVTISDVGTDGSSIINNVMGSAAVATVVATRSARVESRDFDDINRRNVVANGSAGAFISKGTQNSTLGGTDAGQGNTIANNGGNGIEVRTTTSKRNAARGNRVGKNLKGGIALFDGSNEGVTPPKDDGFSVVSRVSATRVRVRVQGTVGRDGSVELFNDQSNQGRFFVGRNNTASGRFDIEVEVNDGENVTGTLTDANGNTSAFQVFGPGLDSDGDGIADVQEDLAGTDKTSISDLPVTGGDVTTNTAAVSLNFAKTGGDTVKLTLRIDLPADYTPAGSTIGVQFAGVAERLALVSKGASAKGATTVKVKGNAGSVGLITFSTKKDLRAPLSQGGFVNSTTLGTVLTESVAVTVNKTLFTGTVNMLYKATQGKSGKASKAK